MFRLIPLLVLVTLIAAAPAGAVDLTVSGPFGAEVTVNGRPMGTLPLGGPIDLPAGRHTVTCTLLGHKNYTTELQLSGDTSAEHLIVRLTPYSRRTAWTSNLVFAGLGQFYLDNDRRGWLYAGAEAGGLLLALSGELTRVNARDDHLVLVDEYRAALNADEIQRLRAAADAKYKDMQDAEDQRNLGLAVAGAAVAVSILDALLTFPDFEAGPGPVPPQASLPAAGNLQLASSFHAGVRLTF